jgi:type VI secretion system protein ImpK
MTPKFSKAVDPVFMQVLGLLDRIEHGKPLDPQQERARIRGWLDQAEAMLGQAGDWQLAKYALVSWIDEVLIGARWDGRDWWNENKMEWEMFKTNDRATRFYLTAKDAAAMAQKDALEVYYVCAMLGFLGIYRDPAAASAVVEGLQMPADLDTWARQTSMAIQLGQGRPRIPEASRAIEGAPPLRGPFALIWSSFFGVALGVVIAIFVWLFIYNA